MKNIRRERETREGERERIRNSIDNIMTGEKPFARSDGTERFQSGVHPCKVPEPYSVVIATSDHSSSTRVHTQRRYLGGGRERET